MAKKDQLVQIHSIVLNPEDRAAHLPEDTKKVPLAMWTKGNLVQDANIGETCQVITMTGRKVSGTLVEVEPRYTHDFGDYVPELDAVRNQVRSILLGGYGND